MALFSEKTRKALAKELKRLVIKHGAQVVVGLIIGLVTEALGDAAEDQLDKKKKPKKRKK